MPALAHAFEHAQRCKCCFIYARAQVRCPLLYFAMLDSHHGACAALLKNAICSQWRFKGVPGRIIALRYAAMELLLDAAHAPFVAAPFS